MKKSFLNGIAAFLIAALAVTLVLACTTPAGNGGGNPSTTPKIDVNNPPPPDYYYAGIAQGQNIYELIITGKAFKLVIYGSSGGTPLDTIEGTVKSNSGSKYYLEAPWVASTTPDDGIYPKTTVLIEATVKDGNITYLTTPGEDDFLPGGLTYKEGTNDIDGFSGPYNEPGKLDAGVAYLVINNQYHDYKVTNIALEDSTGALGFVNSGDQELVVNYQKSSKKIPLKIDFANYSGSLAADVTVTTNDPEKTTADADGTPFDFGKTTIVTVKVKTGGTIETVPDGPK
jgi:hypothetical protein